MIAMETATATLSDRPMLHALAKGWWLLLLRGIAAIVFGVLAFVWPCLTLVTLVLFYGAFALVDGAIQLRKEIDNEWMLILSGVVSVLFGVIVLIAPGAGALGLIWAIAAYSIVFGISFVALALRLRNHKHAAPVAA